MILHITKRPRMIATVAALAVSLIALSTPSARSMLMDGFIEFAQVTEKAACFPYWLVTHTHCFSLDRFDPTCPQCM